MLSNSETVSNVYETLKKPPEKMMTTEIILIPFCLISISICNTIPVKEPNVMGVPLNETENLIGVTLPVLQTSWTSQTITNDITTLLRAVHNSDKMQDRAAALCSNLNPAQKPLCYHAIRANSKLDHLHSSVIDLIKNRLSASYLQPASREVDGNHSIDVTKLTSDLREAATAVCLLGNVSDTTASTGGCCHSDSGVVLEFQQFTDFVQINVFRLLIKEYQMNIVEPFCFEQNVNIGWLVGQVMGTLQKTKQLMNDIDSNQYPLHV